MKNEKCEHHTDPYSGDICKNCDCLFDGKEWVYMEFLRAAHLEGMRIHLGGKMTAHYITKLKELLK